nr:MAG TPA: hypothetical protein [Microviridae sp.]
MDILLQYLNIKKNKQEYIKVVDLPCNTVYQDYNYGHSFTVFEH